ncbi:hypothetical protein FOZ60_000820 [Perkinsus olseni]|uniref:Uncharacterized protein n=1 Tax=Perkinsus olseni TaxID=32597 RepID=A0A7J6PJS6_PEROL|nr:hypothetical protein FOZ60_000820 [Perkinsus olseni]
MIPTIDGSPLFALVFLLQYSSICEATWGMTKENLRAYKTDLPKFDDLFVSKSRGRSTLKANALSEEQIEGMFKGVPTASVITSSPVMKATNSMVKLAIDESGVLGIAEITCPVIVGDDGEEEITSESRIFIDRPSNFPLAFPHWKRGRAGKKYSIKDDLLARNGGSAVVIEDPTYVRRYKRQRSLSREERDAAASWIDEYMLGKLCEMFKDHSKIPNHVKAEDLGDGRAHFTVPHLLPKSILDKPVGFAPAPSTLDIRAPKGQKITRLLTKVFPSRRVRMKRTALPLYALTRETTSLYAFQASDSSLMVTSKDSTSMVVFTRNPRYNVLTVKNGTCPYVKSAEVFPCLFPDYESLTGFTGAQFEAPPGRLNFNTIRWLYIGLMGRVKEPITGSANDLFLRELCRYIEERRAIRLKELEDEQEEDAE